MMHAVPPAADAVPAGGRGGAGRGNHDGALIGTPAGLPGAGLQQVGETLSTGGWTQALRLHSAGLHPGARRRSRRRPGDAVPRPRSGWASAHIFQDDDFASLRGDPDFDAILAEVHAGL